MSTCNVDVRWFPFDIQRCELKFGSWTYDGWLLDLQMSEADISGYMANGEWDLIGEYGPRFAPKENLTEQKSPLLSVAALPGVPGTRNEVFYDCCKEPYPAVTFVVAIRRRTLYYALNLLIPCVLLSSMTLLIFVLPADSGEKISLGEATFSMSQLDNRRNRFNSARQRPPTVKLGHLGIFLLPPVGQGQKEI